MAHYESDATRFLRDLKAQRPEIEMRQRQGRARWWDRALDPDEQRRWAEAQVRQQAYVYQTRTKE